MRRAFDAQDRRRGRLIDAGRCIRCGDESRPDRVRCADCAVRDGERDLASYYAKKTTPARGSKCGLCGVVGHYRQRCPVRRAA